MFSARGIQISILARTYSTATKPAKKAVKKAAATAAAAAPKKPGNAYTFFVRDTYSSLHDKNTPTETFKKIAVEWSNLSDAKKREYHEKASAAIEKYREENPKIKKLRAPASTYILWFKKNFQEVAAKNPGKKAPEIAKLLGAEWKQVSEEVKAELQAEREQLLEEFKKLKAQA